MKAVFLTECGATSGLGHLRRCQVLARAMMADGWICRFALSDANMVSAVRAEGFDAQLWRDDGLDMGPADVLVVDGYHYDPLLFTRWRGHVGVSLAVDDLAERPVPADIVLNHNVYGAELDYSAYGAKVVMGGAEYALVDQKFFSAAKKVRPVPAHILVSFGGTDDGRFSLPVTEALLVGSADAVVKVVISPVQTISAGLLSLKDQYGSRLFVYHGVDMADVMSRCHVLAGAVGVTVLEALAAGLELAVCATADNQRTNVAALRRLDVAAFDGFDPHAVSVAALAAVMVERRAVRAIVDNQGPQRIFYVLNKILAGTTIQGK